MPRITQLLFLFVAVGSLWSCDPMVMTSEPDHAELDSLLLRGISETQQLEFDNAHAHLTELLEIAKEHGNTRYEILANLNLGGLYVHFSSHDEALKYFFQSLEIAEERDETGLLNSIYNNIGVVYSHNESHEKGLEYFSLALDISRQRGEKQRMGMNLINTGISLDALGRDEEALAHFQEAEDIFRESEDFTNLGATLNNTGNLYFDQGSYKVALQMYRKSYRYTSESDQPWYRWEYSINLGKSYYHFGNLDSARHYLNEAVEGYTSVSNTTMLVSAYDWLSKVEESDENLRESLEYARMALAHKDSVLEERSARWVSELQMNFEFGKKEKELELMRETSLRRQTMWITGVAGGVLIFVLLVITLRTTNRNLRQKNVILEQEQAVTQLTIERNKALQEQLKQQMAAREKMNAIEQEALRQEIAFRDRELIAKALHLVNKNEVFTALQDLLSSGGENAKYSSDQLIHKALVLLKSAKNLDKDWESFKRHFEEVHPDFFTSLQQNFPSLSPGDLRMCAYLTLDLSAKEIAQIFNITPDSVRKRKQRLREKLGLGPEQDLGLWLRS